MTRALLLLALLSAVAGCRLITHSDIACDSTANCPSPTVCVAGSCVDGDEGEGEGEGEEGEGEGEGEEGEGEGEEGEGEEGEGEEGEGEGEEGEGEGEEGEGEGEEGEGEGEGVCSSDSDCADDEFCDLDAGGACTTGCRSNGDCDGSDTCVDHVCQAPPPPRATISVALRGLTNFDGTLKFGTQSINLADGATIDVVTATDLVATPTLGVGVTITGCPAALDADGRVCTLRPGDGSVSIEVVFAPLKPAFAFRSGDGGDQQLTALDPVATPALVATHSLTGPTLDGVRIPLPLGAVRIGPTGFENATLAFSSTNGGDGRIAAVLQTADGIYVGGAFHGQLQIASCSLSSVNSTSDDGFVALIGTGGGCVWAARIGNVNPGNSRGAVTSLDVLGANRVFVGGQVVAANPVVQQVNGLSLTTNLGSGSTQGPRGFLIAFDALNGDLVDNFVFDGSGDDVVNAVELAGSGDVIIGGHASANASVPGLGTITGTSTQPFVMRLRSANLASAPTGHPVGGDNSLFDTLTVADNDSVTFAFFDGTTTNVGTLPAGFANNTVISGVANLGLLRARALRVINDGSGAPHLLAALFDGAGNNNPSTLLRVDGNQTVWTRTFTDMRLEGFTVLGPSLVVVGGCGPQAKIDADPVPLAAGPGGGSDFCFFQF